MRGGAVKTFLFRNAGSIIQGWLKNNRQMASPLIFWTPYRWPHLWFSVTQTDGLICSCLYAPKVSSSVILCTLKRLLPCDSLYGQQMASPVILCTPNRWLHLWFSVRLTDGFTCDSLKGHQMASPVILCTPNRWLYLWFSVCPTDVLHTCLALLLFPWKQSDFIVSFRI
jgi:hypothetical protein